MRNSGSTRPRSMTSSTMPSPASISSVAAWVVAARGMSLILASASNTCTGSPWRASARAVMTPTGPPPAIRMGRWEGECMERSYTPSPVRGIAHVRGIECDIAWRPSVMIARRQVLQFVAAAPLLALQSQRAPAQAYPTRPVRVIVTTGPGGQGDTTARLVAAKLTESSGSRSTSRTCPAAAATSPWRPPRAPRRTAIRSSPPPATSSPTSASIRKSPTIPTRTSSRFR